MLSVIAKRNHYIESPNTGALAFPFQSHFKMQNPFDGFDGFVKE